jgi:hypothetical protein
MFSERLCVSTLCSLFGYTIHNSRFISCIGLFHRNCTQHCPWRTWIPQSVCMLDTNMSDGRAQKSTFRDCFFTASTVYIRKKRVHGIHSDRRWDVGAPFHSSNKMSWNKLEWSENTQLFREPKNSKCVSLLEKLWHLYSGMQKEPSTLNSCLGAQQSTRTPTATHYDCVRLFAGRDLYIRREVWSFSMTMQPHTAPVAGNFCTILPTVLTLPRRTSICLGLWKQHLGGRRFHNNQEVEMAAGEWLRM